LHNESQFKSFDLQNLVQQAKSDFRTLAQKGHEEAVVKEYINLGNLNQAQQLKDNLFRKAMNRMDLKSRQLHQPSRGIDAASSMSSTANSYLHKRHQRFKTTQLGLDNKTDLRNLKYNSDGSNTVKKGGTGDGTMNEPSFITDSVP